MASKSPRIFRDPLYNYISIDRNSDEWLLELLDTPELQRLRRIHQLGVTNYTFPGADHSRLSHTLGVVHLTQQALEHLENIYDSSKVRAAREAILAAAMIHDVGHGPFSHLSEPWLGGDHEAWSKKIVLNEEGNVHRVLKKFDKYLPIKVAELIDKENNEHPAWQKALLSSQLDMDRMDYLRRDSLFTGAGYGHFDYYRILNSFEIKDDDLVWPEKSKLAIEEYIFSRFYMYQNVYLHKTTRGFGAMLAAMCKRAKLIGADGGNADYTPALSDFWGAGGGATVEQYCRVEEFTMLQQIQQWEAHADKPLSDLARRFMNRKRYAAIDPPAHDEGLGDPYARWEAALHEDLKKQGRNIETECLKDEVGAKYQQPYFPEKEGDEQGARNAIRIVGAHGGGPTEISALLDRLKPLTGRAPFHRVRYYVPAEMREAVEKIKAVWKPA